MNQKPELAPLQRVALPAVSHYKEADDKSVKHILNE